MTAVHPTGPVHAEVFPRLPLEPNRAELLRYLGYPPAVQATRRLPEMAEEALSGGSSFLAPRGVFSLYDVESQSARSLTLASVTISGAIGHFLRGVTRVAVFVVTVGGEVTAAAQTASRQGNMVAAWALDALGSWAAEAAAESLMARVAVHLGENEAMTLRYSPGYCGMEISEQTALFRLVRAEEIGVSLLPSYLMEPLKSISGIVGIGPTAIIGQRSSPCSNCRDQRCPMRR